MTFKKTVPFLAVLLSTLAGCAYDAPKSERQGGTASAMGGAEGTEFYGVPLGAGYVTPPANMASSYSFGAEEERACGGSYSIDVSVTFGEVTTTSMTVAAIDVTFRAGSAAEMFPGNIDLYSYESHRASADLYPRGDGYTQHYEINRVFTVDDTRSLIIDVHSQAGMPGIDATSKSETMSCAQNGQLLFYPAGSIDGGNELPPVLGPPVPEPVAEEIPPQPEPASSGDPCADGILAPELTFCGQSPGTEHQLFRCEAGTWVEIPCTEGCMPFPDRYGQDYCY